jgi:hypothetical protein
MVALRAFQESVCEVEGLQDSDVYLLIGATTSIGILPLLLLPLSLMLMME